jgi:hypothetical protein
LSKQNESARSVVPTVLPDQGPVREGPADEQPGVFGVVREPIPLPPEVEVDKAAVVAPPSEHALAYKNTVTLLQRIYDLLTGRVRPATVIREIQSPNFWTPTARLRLKHMLLTNGGIAKVATLTVGTQPYVFAIQAFDTIPIPLPLVLENGTTVTLLGDSCTIWLVADAIESD